MTLPADTTPAALDPQSRCPCGSGDVYGGCCLPLPIGCLTTLVAAGVAAAAVARRAE